MGHESVGEIVEVGDDIENFQIGDRICAINVKLDIARGTMNALGIFQDGGFAEYMKVPKDFIFRIPESLSYKEAVMIESFANIARAMRLSKIESKEKIIIIGGGNIGLCFLNALNVKMDPQYVMVIEPHEYLRNKAMELGATAALPPEKRKIRKILKDLKKPSFIFDCVGIEETILLGIDIIKRGGTILLEGIHRGNINLPIFMLNSKEVNLKGCLGHDKEDIKYAISMVEKEGIKPSFFISEEVNLENLQEVFEDMINPKERDYIKKVVNLT
jgi:threonine dehydrogenase-like Zn-dependent dehydrogenase